MKQPILLYWGLVMLLNSNTKFKKIEVLETNNYQLDYFEKSEDRIENQDKALLDYVNQKFLSTANVNSMNDPEIFANILEWVSTQWKHDGRNEPPQNATALDILKLVHNKGERFRCVEYGFVYKEILAALGYTTRSIGMQSIDVAYGGGGSGHVASEVWSNSLAKWIYFDPQFSLYAKYQGSYLSFYEIYKLKKEEKFDQIEFVISKAYLEKNAIKSDEILKEYKQFIQNYFGYLVIRGSRTQDDGVYRAKGASLVLQLDGAKPVFNFQGFGRERSIFTKDIKKFYPNINHVVMSFEYQKGTTDSKKYEQYTKINSGTHQDHMHLIVPEPNFNVFLDHNMKNFSHYLIKTSANTPWQKITEDQFPFQLSEGENTLSVRAINKFGQAGVISYIKFKYR